MQCPRCSAGMATDTARCPECEAPVGKIRAVAAEWTCPRCDRTVTATEPVCESCGLHVGKLRERLDVPSTPASTESSPGEAAGGRSGPGERANPRTSAPRSRSSQSGDAQSKPSQRGAPQPETSQPETSQPQSESAPPRRPGSPPADSRARSETRTRAGTGTPAGDRRPGPSQRVGSGHATNGRVTGGRPGRETGFFAGVPVARAVGLGALAYLGNFVVTYLLATSQFDDGAVEDAVLSELETVGWLFYGGHNVAIRELDALGQEDVNFLHLVYSEGFPLHGAAVPQEAFYVVPMFGLYLAGLCSIRWFSPAGRRLPAVDAAKVGLPLAVGYGTVALVGAATAFRVSADGTTVQPSLSLTFLFAAVCYPVVGGGIGGVVGSR